MSSISENHPERILTSNEKNDTIYDPIASPSERTEADEEQSQKIISTILGSIVPMIRQQLGGFERISPDAPFCPDRPAVVVELASTRMGRKGNGEFHTRKLEFPQIPPRDENFGARELAQFTCVLLSVMRALTDKVPVTKSEIFSQHGNLFRTQDEVDELVDDLAATLNVSLKVMYVRSSK